ncbi:MAG: transcriptional regulator NrdR [Candidatus Krumholzibacteriia bacterium]
MKCPRCAEDNDRVIDSRAVREGSAVRRRRECLACGERFTTYEAVETRPLLVIKKDGRRVPYDRARVMAGLAKACEKRPVPLERLEAIADFVEREAGGSLAREVPSQTIGRLVMEQLREADEVAYVRFASVYRSFRDVEEFMRELRGLLAGREEQP